MIEAILTLDDKKYEGQGETIYNALSSFPVDFTQVKSKGTIKVSDGAKSYEKFYTMKQLRLLTANRGRRALFARQLGYFLEAKGLETRAGDMSE